jgi:integrase
MWFSVRSFLRFAWLTGRLSRDLSGGVPALRRRRLDRVPRALSEEQIRALAESIGSDTAGDLRDGAIVCLLATYGVRGCQIRQLCLEDIDWEESRLRFRACKGGRPVDVPLTVEAGNRLCAYVLRARPKSSLREVFLTFTAPFRPIGSSSQLSRVIHRRLDAVGVVTAEGVSRGCHGFRHAFAMRLVGRVPFKHLVDLLGHRDASTTLVYSKVDMGGLAETALPWPEVTP